MTEHAPGPAGQIWYPGGKNGWWRVNCIAGDHYATESTPERARKRVQQHADSKNE